jgi:hypothetical protein
MSLSGLGQSNSENLVPVCGVLAPAWVSIFSLLNKGDCRIARIPLKTFPARSACVHSSLSTHPSMRAA